MGLKYSLIAGKNSSYRLIIQPNIRNTDMLMIHLAWSLIIGGSCGYFWTLKFPFGPIAKISFYFFLAVYGIFACYGLMMLIVSRSITDLRYSPPIILLALSWLYGRNCALQK
jgi:hypothetical protein